MNILIRLPNWLGDATMATYALEMLFTNFKNAHFFLVGSKASIALFTHYPNTTTLEDTSKTGGFRILNLYKLAKKLPPCNLALTLQNNFLSALFLAFNGATLRIGFAREFRSFLLHLTPKRPKNIHEALRFSLLADAAIQALKTPTEILAIPPKLYLKPKPITPSLPPHFMRAKLAGINAGAAFGAAKRWEESYFAKCIEYLLLHHYKILLFGVESENPINTAILKHLPKRARKQVLNLSGKTDVPTLIAYFSHLEILLTNDSGPMHIAAALEIPTLALFGPTNAQETSPFYAKNARILSLETLGQKLPCMPCMQRTCHLKGLQYHRCMRALTPEFAIKALQSLINEIPIKSQKSRS